MNIALIYNLFLENPTIFTDSRKINGKGIFFALKGEKYNGNEFAKDALRDGATYCIVDDEKIANNSNIIYVKNTLTTLQELATYHRKKLSILNNISLKFFWLIILGIICTSLIHLNSPFT